MQEEIVRDRLVLCPRVESLHQKSRKFVVAKAVGAIDIRLWEENLEEIGVVCCG